MSVNNSLNKKCCFNYKNDQHAILLQAVVFDVFLTKKEKSILGEPCIAFAGPYILDVVSPHMKLESKARIGDARKDDLSNLEK
jgi:hypothetical protein